MRKKLQKYRNLIDSIFDKVAPIAFISSPFANIISLYLTLNKIDIIRKIISWGIIGSFFLICLIRLIVIWKDAKENRTVILKTGIIIYIFLGIYMVSLIITSGDWYIVKKFMLFLLYCIPAFIVALDCGIYHKEISLIKNGCMVGLIIIPGVIFFILKFFGFNFWGDEWDTFGNISYLVLAYGILVVLIFNIAAVYLKVVNSIWEKLGNKISIIVCSMALTVCGSRGVLLSLGVALIAASAVFIIYNRKSWFRVFMRCFGLVLISIFVTLIIVPKNSIGIARVIGLVEEISRGDLEQATKSKESEKIVDRIIEQGGEQSFSEVVKDMTGELEGDKKAETNLQDKYDEKALEAITNGSMGRVYLYKIAIELANDNPILGSGPLAYQRLFETYPHNIILELAADFGYIITGIFVICMAYLAVVFLKSLSRLEERRGVFFLMVAFAVQMMLSGDIYVSVNLIWSIVYLSVTRIIDKKEMIRI